MSRAAKTVLVVVILAASAGAVLWSLTLYSDTGGKYTGESNQQLRSRALALVKKTRELVDSFNSKDRDMAVDYEKDYLATRTTERQRVRDQYENKLKETHDLAVRDYKKQGLSEARTIRAALHARLPKRLQRPQLTKIYENPSKLLEIQIIADDLELLAKSLPEN